MANVKRWPLRKVETRVNVWTVCQNNGRCREVVVSKGLTVAIINDHFFLSFHSPLLWFPLLWTLYLGPKRISSGWILTVL